MCHAATTSRVGGERSWSSAAVSLSMTSIGPPHFGQSQASLALREDLPPTQASFQRLDLDRLVKEWDEIVAGVSFALNFLDEEKIFDSERLPTIGVLYTLAAVQDCVPRVLDASGNAKALLRKYLWRAFATNRYENNAAARSLQDARGYGRAFMASLSSTGITPTDHVAGTLNAIVFVFLRVRR